MNQKNENPRFDSAVNFLLYSYFGIVMQDMQDNQDYVLKRIIARANPDAASPEP